MDEQKEDQERRQKFNYGWDSSFMSQFGNLYFLLLTQTRTAHIFHPASEHRINQNLLEYHKTDTQAWEGWRMQWLKPLLLFSLLVLLSLCWLLSEEATVYWTVHSFHSPTVTPHSCTISEPATITSFA